MKAYKTLMKLHRSIILLTIGFPFLLYGCEGGTTFTKSIQNLTNEPFQLTVRMENSSDTFQIEPMEELQFYWSDQMGYFTDDSYACVHEIDTISLQLIQGGSILIDPMDPASWMKLSESGRNSKEDCILIITPSDISLEP